MNNKIAMFIALLLLSSKSKAQLTVDNSLSPTQLVENVLLGGGVTASSISYTGATIARGAFGGVSNIGLNSGIILSTGKISSAIGPNNATAISADNSLAGDVDLNLLMSPAVSADASVLEFDFIPTADTLKFRYVFASDEYMEYVSTGSLVNDVFGFFISGPGIFGPYTGGAQNIAMIPGTTLPVTMQNLNKTSAYSSFYVDNGDGIPGTASGTAPDGSTVQYDGFTVPLTATAVVQNGQTYHIKIAVADGGAVLDRTVDSGVFLEAGSFSSQDPTITILNVPNIITPNNSGPKENEFFYVQNLNHFPQSSLIIYNRWGSKIYENKDYHNDWNGDGHADGTYYYVLSVPTSDKNQAKSKIAASEAGSFKEIENTNDKIFTGFFQIAR